MHMKAVVINKSGVKSSLSIEERPIPVILPDEVLIEVKAAGVNRPDIYQRKGNYPAPEGAPKDIPGLEVAGVIKAVGSRVRKWRVGQNVCALVSGGGYAQYTKAHALHCLPIPPLISLTEAAGLPETVFTVWHNVFVRGNLKPGQKLLVHGGSSGIGVTAIQLAKSFGATVYATAGSDEKCKACLDLGASVCINYKHYDFEKVFSKEGVDVILDMVGGTYFEKNLQILNEDGYLVAINAMQGSLVQLNIKKMMQKRLTITGSTLRSRNTQFKASLAEEVEKNVWPKLLNGELKPLIYAIFPLEEAMLAHELMEHSTHIGKIVLSMPPL